MENVMSTRPTLKMLSGHQRAASCQFPVGSHWRHQSSGKVYEVTGHVTLEASGEAAVCYRPAECDDLELLTFGEAPSSEVVFARPAHEFSEAVSYHDGSVTRLGPRFVPVIRQTRWVSP